MGYFFDVGAQTDMTTIIKQQTASADLQAEISQMRAAAKKAARSRASAVRFLQSTGMHDAKGRLKPQFR